MLDDVVREVFHVTVLHIGRLDNLATALSLRSTLEGGINLPRPKHNMEDDVYNNDKKHIAYMPFDISVACSMIGFWHDCMPSGTASHLNLSAVIKDMKQ